MGIINSYFKANALSAAISKATASIARSDVLRIIWKVVDLELGNQAVGAGKTKLEILLGWAKTSFNLTDAQIEIVEKIAAAAVALFNAVGLFRQLKKG